MAMRASAQPDPRGLDILACRLGVLGGTFDPIHVGHLIVAEEARARFALDTVVFVPARVSPLKPEGTLFSASDRLRMVQLAIEDNPCFRASSIDLEREGPSYTVDTLRALKAENGPRTQLFFIMGMDSLCTLSSWHRPREIIRLTRIIALSRPGFDVDWSALEESIPGIAQATELIPTLEIGISSTDIRQRLQQGLPIKYRVPKSVEAYIRKHSDRGEPGPYMLDPCC